MPQRVGPPTPERQGDDTTESELGQGRAEDLAEEIAVRTVSGIGPSTAIPTPPTTDPTVGSDRDGRAADDGAQSAQPWILACVLSRPGPPDPCLARHPAVAGSPDRLHVRGDSGRANRRVEPSAHARDPGHGFGGACRAEPDGARGRPAARADARPLAVPHVRAPGRGTRGGGCARRARGLADTGRRGPRAHLGGHRRGPHLRAAGRARRGPARIGRRLIPRHAGPPACRPRVPQAEAHASRAADGPDRRPQLAGARNPDARRSNAGARQAGALGRLSRGRLASPPPGGDARESGGHPPWRQRRHPWLPLARQGRGPGAGGEHARVRCPDPAPRERRARTPGRRRGEHRQPRHRRCVAELPDDGHDLRA